MRAVILIVCLATLARGYPGAFYDFKDVATPCLKANCTIEEDCVCSGSASPISKDDTPQVSKKFLCSELSINSAILSVCYNNNR